MSKVQETGDHLARTKARITHANPSEMDPTRAPLAHGAVGARSHTEVRIQQAALHTTAVSIRRRTLTSRARNTSLQEIDVHRRHDNDAMVAWLQSLLGRIPDLIILFGSEGIVRYVSAQWGAAPLWAAC